MRENTKLGVAEAAVKRGPRQYEPRSTSEGEEGITALEDPLCLFSNEDNEVDSTKGI